MSIPGSGQVSISDIYNEKNEAGKGGSFSLARLSMGDRNSFTSSGLGYAGIDQNSTSKPNRTAQHSISEFYSYNHSQNGSCGTSYPDQLDFCSLLWSYFRINVTGASGYNVNVVVNVPKRSGTEPFGPFTNGYFQLYTSYPFDSTGSLTGTPVWWTSTGSSPTTESYTHIMSSTSEVLYIVTYSDNGNCGV